MFGDNVVLSGDFLFNDDEQQILRVLQESRVIQLVNETCYDFVFDRDENDVIIRVHGYAKFSSYSRFSPYCFSVPCVDGVLGSCDDEPGVFYYEEDLSDYDEIWFLNGERKRFGGKPFLVSYRDSMLSSVDYDDMTRNGVYPVSYSFGDDGVLERVSWSDKARFSSQPLTLKCVNYKNSVITSKSFVNSTVCGVYPLHYSFDESGELTQVSWVYSGESIVSSNIVLKKIQYNNGFGFIKSFNENNSSLGCLAGVYLYYSTSDFKLLTMGKVSVKNDDEYTYEFCYDVHGVLRKKTWLVNNRRSNITGPAVLSYDRHGVLNSEEYWYHDTFIVLKSDWLKLPEVVEYHRGLANKSGVANNISL